MDKPGPISLMLCAVAALATLAVSVVFLPAAELLPAQINPAPRTSGESFLRELPGASDLMKSYANTGVEVLKMLPPPPVPEPGEKEDSSTEKAVPNQDLVQQWQSQLKENHGDKYSSLLIKNIEDNLGGQENVKSVLALMQKDKNYIYNAYALFMGLALLFAAIAIQAMGRWGAELKTILPAKK